MNAEQKAALRINLLGMLWTVVKKPLLTLLKEIGIELVTAQLQEWIDKGEVEKAPCLPPKVLDPDTGACKDGIG